MNTQSNIVFSLDLKSESEIISFEKSLYRAFSTSLTNTSHLIFNINHREKRIHSRIPYDSQEIYVLKWSGTIVAGIAVNFDMNHTLQLELLNFHIKSRDKACEVLSFFSALDYMNSMNTLKDLARVFVSKIKEKEISTVYATSSEKKAVSYKFLGFKVIDQYSFEGQEKCLLQLAI